MGRTDATYGSHRRVGQLLILPLIHLIRSQTASQTAPAKVKVNPAKGRHSMKGRKGFTVFFIVQRDVQKTKLNIITTEIVTTKTTSHLLPLFLNAPTQFHVQSSFKGTILAPYPDSNNQRLLEEMTAGHSYFLQRYSYVLCTTYDHDFSTKKFNTQT